MYIVFDTETTGKPKDYKGKISDVDNWPRVIQLAWAIYNEDGTLIDHDCDLIRPNGWVVPNEPFWINNGFTTEKNALDGVDIKAALEQFVRAANRCHTLIAHNIAFDYPVLGAEAFRAGIKTDKRLRQLCTMEASKDFCKLLPLRRGEYKWPSLTELHNKLFQTGFDGAHDAMADVYACAKCFFELKAKGIITITSNI